MRDVLTSLSVKPTEYADQYAVAQQLVIIDERVENFEQLMADLQAEQRFVNRKHNRPAESIVRRDRPDHGTIGWQRPI